MDKNQIDKSNLISRDLSWLNFNHRVLDLVKKNCNTNKNCKIINSEGELNSELKLAILKKAAKYESTKDTKNKRDYNIIKLPEDR